MIMGLIFGSPSGSQSLPELINVSSPKELLTVFVHHFPEYFEQHQFDYLDWRVSDYEILIPQIN